MYNELVTVKNNVEKAWKNIDVVLQQRHDELLKQVDTCKAYIKHESELLLKITKLRTGYNMAKEFEEKIKIENEMNGLLEKAKLVWEQYPNLKAVQVFIQIQVRISFLESKISDYREIFNDAVNIYNITLERFPEFLLARYMSYQRHSFLKIPEDKKQDVNMDFS